jgi:glycosyltransferase involved in cell wall biosynthesis
MEQLKIAFFAALLPSAGRKVGGVDYAIHRLANELAKTEIVTVFSLSECPDNAIYHHKKVFYSWLARPLARLCILPWLLNFIDFSDFDVLHIHGDDWFYLWRTCPTVRSMHGSSLREAVTATTLKRKAWCFLAYCLERLSIALADVSLAVGGGTASQYRLTRVVDNGFDPTVFFPGEKAKEPILLYVGTWKGRKRGSFLFNLFVTRIYPQFPTAKLHMVTDYCADHKNVIHERYPSDLELARLYRKAWIFAYPSVYEGFGIPYLESLASGTAIVCSPNEGATYVLENGTFGLIVEDEAFADALLELLQDDKKRSALARAGVERASGLTWTVSALDHHSFYQEAIEDFRK